MLAVLFVAIVPAVVATVADGGGQGAVAVVALELSILANPVGTRLRLIRAVRTILGAVALPVEGNALVVGATAPVLTLGAVGYTGSVVSSQDEVCWTFAGEGGSFHVVGSNQTKMGTSTVPLLAGVVVSNLPERVVNVYVVGPVCCIPKGGVIVPSKFMSL